MQVISNDYDFETFINNYGRAVMIQALLAPWNTVISKTKTCVLVVVYMLSRGGRIQKITHVIKEFTSLEALSAIKEIK
jgi:hypothetical protein